MALISGAAAEAAVAEGVARWLAGGPTAFTLLAGRRRHGATHLKPVNAARSVARLTGLSAVPPNFAGLSLDRPRIMGILNVTPDSFSDGGRHLDPSLAVAQGRRLIRAGADIIDVGGESTRPGARPVPAAEQCRRIVPVVAALATAGAVISVDTRDARVMAAALDAGARIVNDISALRADRDALAEVARRGAAVVLMHMAGRPETGLVPARYANVSLDVYDFLEQRIAACRAAGITDLAVDPGICFGKRATDNRALLEDLALFAGLGVGFMLGVSRKGFAADVERLKVTERGPASLAAALHGVARGVRLLRVHDVVGTRFALDAWLALNAAS